jgi:FkbM family methyltransferase
MITKTQIFLKEKYPNFYKIVRNSLFPITDKLRSRKRERFNERQTIKVSPLGHTFFINIDPQNGFIDQHIFATGIYEPDILKAFTEHLSDGDVFVDIGGNIGWHSLFASAIVGKNGHVHTFEPLEKLRNQFNSSLEANDFKNIVTVHPFGLGKTDEDLQIHLNPINIGGSSIFNNGHDNTSTIHIKNGDSVLSNLDKITLIKIDTEGYEVEVLSGLKNTLKNKTPKLIVEYSPSFWGEEKIDRGTEFFNILCSVNYSILDMEDGYREIIDHESWINDFDKLQTNLLCLPK